MSGDLAAFIYGENGILTKGKNGSLSTINQQGYKLETADMYLIYN